MDTQGDPVTTVLGSVLAVAAVFFGMFVGGAKAATVLAGGSLERATSKMIPALTALWEQPGDPAGAWADPDVPGPVMYWGVTGLVVFAGLVVGLLVLRLFRRSQVRFDERSRLGSSPEAELATARDLAPLIVRRPVGDRYLLGRIGWRKFLAAENRQSRFAAGPRFGAGSKHVKDRGAVMVLGPSRTGKSVSVISSMLHWEGPIVAVSVKDDLMRPTLAHRRRMGDVAVFDPTGFLSEAYVSERDRPPAFDSGLLANWSPLMGIGSFDDALSAAAMLSEASPRGMGDQNQFFIESAEIMLGPMMWLAAMLDKPLGDVVSWVMSRPPTSDGDGGRGQFELTEMAGLFSQLRGKVHTDSAKRLTEAEQQRLARIAEELPHAEQALKSQIEAAGKTMDSVYSTLQTMIKPWVSPTVRGSADNGGRLVDLSWLLSGCNTLFITARPSDFARLTPVYGGFVNDLLGQVYSHFNRHGPIESPLLVVLDEVGNMPVKKLPEFASLLSGMGVQLVTIWQDIAQIRTAYGDATDNILSNHLSKLFFGGSSGLEHLRYASALAGEEEVHSHSRSLDAGTARGGSVSESPHRTALVPVNVIRQMPKDRALLIHGSLPPAYVSTLPFYEQRRLRRLGRWSDRDVIRVETERLERERIEKAKNPAHNPVPSLGPVPSENPSAIEDRSAIEERRVVGSSTTDVLTGAVGDPRLVRPVSPRSTTNTEVST